MLHTAQRAGDEFGVSLPGNLMEVTKEMTEDECSCF